MDIHLKSPGVRDYHPLRYPVPRDLARPVGDRVSRPQFRASTDSHHELFPFQSPLLGESWLVSFPPLNNMLKFSGSSCLIRGHQLGGIVHSDQPIHERPFVRRSFCLPQQRLHPDPVADYGLGVILTLSVEPLVGDQFSAENKVLTLMV